MRETQAGDGRFGRGLLKMAAAQSRAMPSLSTGDLHRAASMAVASKASRVRGGGVKPVRVVLDNGLTVLLQENHVAPVVALNMWVKVGSVYESDAEAGISHVYEHMLFKGTAMRGVGEIAQEIEGAGGDINAYTSFDHTVYYIVVASRFLDTALDVMADAIQHSAFDPEELRKEQEVVLEEIKRGEDIPSRKLTEELFATSYRCHPYRRPVIGSEHTVKALTREHILRFFHTWYVPNNMVLVLAGDFDQTEVLSRIRAAFADFQPQPLPPLHIPPEPAQRELRTVILADSIQEALLEMAYHVPGAGHKDSYALDLLSFILGGGESARLYQTVKAEQELLHSVYAYSFLPKDPGLLIISAALDEAHWQAALRGILSEVERVWRDGVTVAELDKAKRNLESEFIYQRETVQGQARHLGYLDAVLGDLAFEGRYLKGIARTTPQDIQRVARLYLNPGNLTVGFFLPASSRARVTPEGVMRTVMAKPQPSPRRRLLASPSAKPTHKYVLDNGMTLLVRENRAVPVVAMQAVFLGGLWVEDAAHNGVMNFIAEMVTKGTTHRSALALAEEIESMAGDLSGFSGRNSFGVTAEVLHRDLRQGLDLLADTLINPTFERDELERKRTDILAAIRQEEDDLFKVTFNLFVQTLFPDHPYGLRVLGTPESVSGLTQDDLLTWYRRYAAPNNLVLAVVGDVEAEAVQREVVRLFGGWSATALALPPPGREIQPVHGRHRYCLKEKEQTHIILGVRGTSLHHPDRYPLRVLESILSNQGGRLFVELREKQSLAYTVAARSLEGLDPFVFFVYIATSPDKAEVALEGIRAELRKVREHGVSTVEVERAKRYLVGSYEIELQKNSAQAATLAFDERYGLGIQEFETYAQKILAVTPEMVQQVARSYLAIEQAVGVTVGPSRPRGVGMGPCAEGVVS
ncbi:MAG TPA: pitrilysin family protein [Alphaproteobacteria bacterium]|nr:pitrilysin family protein [Alphaproteobacteria bacterium]